MILSLAVALTILVIFLPIHIRGNNFGTIQDAKAIDEYDKPVLSRLRKDEIDYDKHMIKFVLQFSNTQKMLPEKEAKIEWYLPDHLGSTSLLVDENGQVVSEVAYYPYGLTRYQDNGEHIAYGFTGKELDVSGLHYYGVRYHDGPNGRFINVDPLYAQQPERNLPDPQSLNLYAYAGNNPINYSDPTGLEREEIRAKVIEYARKATKKYLPFPLSELFGSPKSVNTKTKAYLYLRKDSDGQPIKGTLSVESYKGTAHHDINNDNKNDSCVRCLQFIAQREKVYNTKTQKWGPAPTTRNWKQGLDVREAINQNKIEPGTLIATFVDGKYPNKPTGNHAAIYIDAIRDDRGNLRGITVFDSWSNRDDGPGYRPIYFKGNPNVDRSNNASSFSIVE